MYCLKKKSHLVERTAEKEKNYYFILSFREPRLPHKTAGALWFALHAGYHHIQDTTNQRTSPFNYVKLTSEFVT